MLLMYANIRVSVKQPTDDNINNRCNKGNKYMVKKTTDESTTEVTTGTITVSSIVRKLYVEHEGQLIEVAQIDNPQDYPVSTKIFSKQLVKGANKGQMTYCVPIEDFTPKAKVPRAVQLANSVEAMKAQGMSPQEIIDQLTAVKNV